MFVSTARLIFLAASVALVSAAPVAEEGATIAKREVSYGDPDLVIDHGDRFELNFGSTSGHENACPGHYICYISRNGGAPHDAVSLGDPDNMVDEGNRWRLNYGDTEGHPNACDGHYICYISK